MADPADLVAEHYRSADLLSRIEAGLRQLGASAEAPRPEDLRAVDEFHIGGGEATDALLDRLDLPQGTRALDLGSGLGGPARHMAGRGFDVTGIDLTPDYVAVAQELSRRAGVAARFVQGSATDLPFADAAFDLVTLIHVGMNIPDKRALCAEAARVLGPGGIFAVYDVMRLGEAHPGFPLPWAAQPEASALDRPEAYLEAAGAAGLTPIHRRDRGDYARAFFAELTAAMARDGPPPLGIHLLMGETARQKVANMVAALEAGMIAPVELFFRKEG